MAETEDRDHRDEDTAKLELPSLALPRLGRRKRRGTEQEGPATTAAGTSPVETPVPEPTAPTTPAAPEPAPAPEPVPVPVVPEPVPDGTSPVETPAREVPEGRTGGDSWRSARRTSWSPSGLTVPSLPTLTTRAAVLLTGAVVGIAGAALTFGSLQGCAAVRGTETCGGAVGLPLLVVILVLMALLGSVLLTAWAVAEPRSTAVLGVGALAVLVLLFSMGESLSPWMFLVVPVLAALCHLLAHWVSTALVETPADHGPTVDVR